VAKVEYKSYGNEYCKVLVSTMSNNHDVGICLINKIFFLPYHVVDRDEASMKKFFKKLSNGLVSLFKKYQQDLPEWAIDYKFSKEIKLFKDKEKLVKELDIIKDKLDIFMNYKKILVLSDEPLKELVADVLEGVCCLKVDRKDEFIEDLKIYYNNKVENKTYKALVEIKGVNKNVDRASISQLDVHRDRRGLESSFQGILIINTFIKSSNSIKNKDRPVSSEQIKHAANMNILIIRTIDLLRTLNIVIDNVKKHKEFINILFSENGWLELKNNEFIIHND